MKQGMYLLVTADFTAFITNNNYSTSGLGTVEKGSILKILLDVTSERNRTYHGQSFFLCDNLTSGQRVQTNITLAKVQVITDKDTLKTLKLLYESND